jgi:ribosome-binding ATPase
MRIAILGLPQAGKKTFLELLTGRPVPANRKAEEAVEGISLIGDPRVDGLSKLFEPQKTSFAENNYVLCPDLTEGGGKRPWMEAARRCDLLCLLVRGFDSEQVYHPAGSVDADRDRGSLEAELMLADMVMLENRLSRIEKEKKAGQSAAQQIEEKALLRCMAELEEGRLPSNLEFEEQEYTAIQSLGMMTLLPILWVYNVAEDGLEKNFGPATFTISCQIEKEITEIEDPEERSEYLATIGLSSLGKDRTNLAAYDALGQMSFYTVGKDEVKAWTVRKGSRAPRAGGKIHSDIERGFIRVEVIKYDDLIEAGSEKVVKDQGKMQLKGKEYVMEDGDICHFLFNV